jgi:hypothetical protein
MTAESTLLLFFFIPIGVMFVLLDKLGLKSWIPEKWNKKAQGRLDWSQVIISIGLFATGCGLLVCPACYAAIAPAAAGTAVGYFAWILWNAACGGGDLPMKKPALFIMPLVVASLILFFARMYFDSTGQPSRCDCHSACAPISEAVRVDSPGGKGPLSSRFDSVYFSTTIFTTLGDGNFAVFGRRTRTIVLLEQFCSFVSLVCVFSVLASRLSIFDSDKVTIALVPGSNAFKVGPTEYTIIFKSTAPASADSTAAAGPQPEQKSSKAVPPTYEITVKQLDPGEDKAAPPQ